MNNFINFYKIPNRIYFIHRFFILFKILPLSLARIIGSSIATSIGPLLPVHSIAKKNIKIAFPDKENEWQKKVLKRNLA